MRGPAVALLSVVLASAITYGADTAQNASSAKPQKQEASAAQQPGKEAAKNAKTEENPLYVVEDGNKVDPKTLQGWKTWRALACERCHGAAQEGLVGPALRDTIKNISKEEFHEIMLKGRPEKGMPPFSASKMVMENWEGLYAYLRGRSDGKIEPGRLSPLESK